MGNGKPALDGIRVLDAMQFQARGMLRKIAHPTRGEFRMPARLVEMSDTDVPIAPAPPHGAQNDIVPDGWLGLTSATIAALKSDDRV